jgi:hypothetical protein
MAIPKIPDNALRRFRPRQSDIDPDKHMGRRHSITALLLLIGTALVIGGSTVWFLRVSGTTDPDTLFTAMISNSLTLESYRSEMIITNTYLPNERLELKSKVSDDGKSARSFINYNHHDGNASLDVDTYLSDKTMLAKVNRYPTQAPLDPAVMGNWAKLAQGQSAIDQNSSPIQIHTTALQSRTGEIPMGNFDAADRKAILDFIKSKQVYESARDPVRFQQDGREIYQYEVTTSLDKLQSLNKLVARLTDEDYSQIGQLYNRRETTRMKIIVDIDTQQLISMEILDNDGEHTVTRYDGHNKAAKIAEPAAAIQAQGLNELISSVNR